MPTPFKEQLIKFKEQNNLQGMMDFIYDKLVQGISVHYLKNEKLVQLENQELADFWQEAIENGEDQFILDFIDAYSKDRVKKAYLFGHKIDEWKQKIKNGEVPELVLFKDDDKFIDKLSHDIVLLHEKNMDCLGVTCKQLTFLFNATKKTVTADNKIIEKPYEIDGTPLMKIYVHKAKEYYKTLGQEYGVTEKQLENYDLLMNDIEPSSHLEFKLKQKKPAPGESLFDEVPDYLTRIKNEETPEALDAYEDELFEIVDEYNIHSMTGRSSAKLFTYLHDRLKKLDDEEDIDAVRSKAFLDLMPNLEHATHLGKDYIVRNPDHPNNTPRSDFNFSVVDDALIHLGSPAENFYNEKIARLQELTDRNIQSGKAYDHAFNMKDAAICLKTLKDNLGRKNDAFGTLNILSDDVKRNEKIQKIIDKERQRRGYISHNQYKSNNYVKTLSEQEQNLSDSIMNDLIVMEDVNAHYKPLFKLIEKNKRLYVRMLAADNAKDNIQGENRFEAQRKYREAYEENCRLINEQIARCKEFENTFNNPWNVSGPSMNRTEILDRIAKTLTRQPLPIDENKFRNTFSAQKNDLDTLWFAMQYSNMTKIKEAGQGVPEQYRETLGFNLDGGITDTDKKTADKFLKHAFLKCAGEKSLADLIKLGENIGRLKVKMCVNSGKDFESISNALSKEVKGDLKAKYLFNRTGASLETLGIKSCEDKFKQFFTSVLRKEGGIESIIDVNNEELTFDGLFNSLGLSEEEKQALCAKEQDPDMLTKKLSDSFDAENPEEYRKALCEFIASTMQSVCSQRGAKYEQARLSGMEKKYLNLFEENVDPDTDYTEIKEWIEKNGDETAAKLNSVMLAEKMQKHQASLNAGKPMGVDPKTEIGRFYNNKLLEKDTYIKSLFKEKKQPQQIIDDIITEKRNENLVNFNVKKLPVNYDTYITLHTGERAGETADEMVDNLAKCLAASALKKMGRSFSKRDIHRNAEMYKNLLVLDVLKDDPKKLRESLRDANSVAKIGNELRQSLFGVKPENEKRYFDELNELLMNMSGDRGRSTKYKNLRKAIDDAISIKYEKMTPEKRQAAILNANISILSAVQNYTAGKEKVRKTPVGQDSFDNALDAMAIIEKHSPGFQMHSIKLLNKINRVRNNNDPTAANYISHENFTKNYGAEHSWSIAFGQKNPEKDSPFEIMTGKYNTKLMK